MAKDNLSVNELKHRLSYDPTSGLFVWLNPATLAGHVAGTVSNGYIRIIINGSAYLAHRLAWLYVNGKFPEGEIDHVNGTRSDNKISNLRAANRGQNCQNKRSSRIGLRGVQRIKKSGKWVAQIGFGGKRYHLGTFDSQSDAASAYADAAAKHHGEFRPPQ